MIYRIIFYKKIYLYKNFFSNLIYMSYLDKKIFVPTFIVLSKMLRKLDWHPGEGLKYHLFRIKGKRLVIYFKKIISFLELSFNGEKYFNIYKQCRKKLNRNVRRAAFFFLNLFFLHINNAFLSKKIGTG